MHCDQVGVALAVPQHLPAPPSSRRRLQVPQADQGVCSAGGRVAVRAGRLAGPRRVRRPPGLDRGVVDPGGQERSAVRRPPKASRPRHLLGRNELRGAPGHCPLLVAALLVRALLVTAGLFSDNEVGLLTPDRHDVQTGPGQKGDVMAGRVRTRVDHASRSGQLDRGSRPGSVARPQAHPPQLAVEGKGGVAHRFVTGVAGHAPGQFPAALAASSFFVREVLVASPEDSGGPPPPPAPHQ